MKIPKTLTRAVSVAIVVLCGCTANETVAPPAAILWRSDHFDILVPLGDGWKKSHVRSPGDTFDRPGNLVQAFLKSSGPYGYIIKIEKDAPLDQLPLEEYQAIVRKQFTSLPEYELVDEGDVDFHGRKFHRFRLKVDGTKGAAAMYAHIFRDGTNLVSVQWTFPLGTDGQLIVPEAITRFDKGVAINFLAQPNE